MRCKHFIIIHYFNSYFFKNIFNRFYYPRFNPSNYYSFINEKLNSNKHKTENIKLSKVIIATKKYIDRHYNHFYDADTLLLRLKNVKSNYDILTQLPMNYLIGVVTGIVSAFITSDILVGKSLISNFYYSILCVFITSLLIILLYYAIKSFYSEFDSIIIPYEISKIKEQLSNLDNIYSNY